MRPIADEADAHVSPLGERRDAAPAGRYSAKAKWMGPGDTVRIGIMCNTQL
jgi:hypothetical protein